MKTCKKHPKDDGKSTTGCKTCRADRRKANGATKKETAKSVVLPTLEQYGSATLEDRGKMNQIIEHEIARRVITPAKLPVGLHSMVALFRVAARTALNNELSLQDAIRLLLVADDEVAAIREAQIRSEALLRAQSPSKAVN